MPLTKKLACPHFITGKLYVTKKPLYEYWLYTQWGEPRKPLLVIPCGSCVFMINSQGLAKIQQSADGRFIVTCMYKSIIVDIWAHKKDLSLI